ncbi:something about silencing protein 10 [Toxorhynchites rutilus septentrionalis]|uniref:something about silencing protein 10 n=1 Tax=Toxorhynchites rutilus septentrionalis TaxID=329112 RepID=UPI002479D4AF|nr:something about silencing protein 10 [Toxorhynchites rutilus septentrionalis]
MPDKISIYDVGDRYDPSESEGEYDEREKKLLTKIRHRKDRNRFGGDEEEVLGFAEDDDDEEEDEEAEFDEIRKFEHDSDIEEKDDDDDLPNRKAWGSKARNFYGTDYVDQDYDSLTAQEEERARLEEIEAKEIQQRLAKELNEADFSLDIFVPEQDAADLEPTKSKKKKDKSEIRLKTDLSDLSDRQKRELFRKEAPEFDGLVEDFEKYLQDCHETMEPVLMYLRERNITEHPFITMLKTRFEMCLNYCNNISFYLLLKAKKIKVQNHPVVKRMVQMKQLLLELDQKYANTIKSQVETILEHIASGKELVFSDEPIAEKVESPKKKKLAALQNIEKYEQQEEGDQSDEDSDDDFSGEDVSDDEEISSAKKLRLESESEDEQLPGDEAMDEDQEETMDDAEGKRKITYQMAKNKGLTAHKKKEHRNIRVKNRRKFQKALVRRKGAIRPVRTETTRYAGEATGIKAYVKRSVKIK